MMQKLNSNKPADSNVSVLEKINRRLKLNKLRESNIEMIDERRKKRTYGTMN